MKKIKLLLISCILIVVFALSGCIRLETSFVVHENDSVTMNVKYAFNKEKADAAMEEIMAGAGDLISTEEIESAFAQYSKETINGEQYYVENISQTYTQQELKEEGFPVIVNKDKFYFYVAADESGEDIGNLSNPALEQNLPFPGLSPDDIEYIRCSVSLPSPVVETNGKIQEDTTTVVWDLTALDAQEYELYAYTANDPADRKADRQTVLAMLASANSPSPSPTPSPSPDVPGIDNTTNSKDTKAPVIKVKGIKKKQTYKKKVTVYVKDNKKLKKVTVNGKKVKLSKVKKGKYKGYFKFTVKKKGKIKIIAYDAAGNKKKIRIKIK